MSAMKHPVLSSPVHAGASLPRRLVAEGLGTALLLAIVVGSAIMGDRLAGGNAAIALLVNAIASGCGLVVLILAFGGVSGAHLNPVATFGLMATIIGCARTRPAATPHAAALFIVAGYWFTASSSFANPALTLARAATDTCAGIRLADVPGYVLAQLAGGAAATVVFGWLYPRTPAVAHAAVAVRDFAPAD
jgi:glycerol uptake facilitator-like aquaporin